MEILDNNVKEKHSPILNYVFMLYFTYRLVAPFLTKGIPNNKTLVFGLAFYSILILNETIIITYKRLFTFNKIVSIFVVPIFSIIVLINLVNSIKNFNHQVFLENNIFNFDSYFFVTFTTVFIITLIIRIILFFIKKHSN